MNDELSLRIIFGLLLVGLLAMRLYFHHKAGTFQDDQADFQQSRYITLLQWIGLLFVLTYPLAYLFRPDWLRWSMIARATWIGWAGAGLFTLGLAGLTWVNYSLGQHFSTVLIVRADQQIVKTGPYRWVRHPMYTAILTILLGWMLMIGSWLMGIMNIFFIIVFMGVRLRQEEAMLCQKFGEAYERYMAETGRFLPHFHRG